MRTISLILCLLLAGPADDVRDEEAFVPGAEPAGLHQIHVVSAGTGHPVGGALVRQYEEDASDDMLAAELLGEAVTDEWGLASLPATESTAWWVVTKPGYGAGETSGSSGFPPGTVELLPATSIEGRILLPDGRPAAGARIECFYGCGHGPTFAKTEADADGRFRLSGLSPDVRPSLVSNSVTGIVEGMLWVEAPGLAPTYTLPRGGDLVWPVGVTITGRVAYEAGTPWPDVVVRGWNEAGRGPKTVTGPNGAFALHGVESYDGVSFYAPGWVARAQIDEDEFEPGRPITVVLRPGDDVGDGRTDPDAETSRVVARVRNAPGGRPVKFLPVRLLRESDGRVFADRTEADGRRRGVARLRVPPGEYVLSCGSPFSRYSVAPRRIETVEGGSRFELVAEEHPRVRVTGRRPPEARVFLVAKGAETELPGPAWLDADAPAVVRVEAEGIVRFFPVGPEEEGVRRAVVDWPKPKTLVIEAPEDSDFGLAGEWHFMTSSSSLQTHASGPVDLLVEHPRFGRLAVPVVIPAEAGARMVVSASRLPAPGEVRVLDTDGNPAAVATLRIAPLGNEREPDDDGRDRSWHYATGTTVVLDLGPDVAPVLRTLEGDGPWTLRPGSASLTIDTGEGEPTFVLLDGKVFSAEEGTVTIRGFDPGPVRALVSTRGRLSRSLRVTLGDGETRAVAVSLLPR